MRYLKAEELIAINTAVLMGTAEKSRIHNAKGLASIIALPQQAFFDIEAYPEINEKIGIVFIKVINLHPFEDGNKRTAVMAAVIMAKLNGFQIDFSNHEIAELALRVAKTDESELNYEDVYVAFDQHLHQLG